MKILKFADNLPSGQHKIKGLLEQYVSKLKNVGGKMHKTHPRQHDISQKPCPMVLASNSSLKYHMEIWRQSSLWTT
jgi:hypothetical protein